MNGQDVRLVNELSDEEERAELAEALVVKAEGKRRMKQGRRTFLQAKTLVREIRKQRTKPRFFPKARANLMLHDQRHC